MRSICPQVFRLKFNGSSDYAFGRSISLSALRWAISAFGLWAHHRRRYRALCQHALEAGFNESSSALALVANLANRSSARGLLNPESLLLELDAHYLGNRPMYRQRRRLGSHP